ncbi:hypothetical protein AAFN46_10765 [Pseudomonas sp. CAU 1711]|uniref:hypothetical protein n=1 Tax=Pseudomonas sp. CAU 1711 TaxID=3140356 RepID=UPI003261970D
MSVEEKQLTPIRPASALEPRGGLNQEHALALVGLSVLQAEGAPRRFEPRWFRAWEAQLHRRAARQTGRRQWDFSRFSQDGGLEAAKVGYRDTLTAVAQAAKQAVAAAEASCGRRGPRERMALLYFDFWGQCSHLEQAFNWRDSFDLDVIPKFILRDQATEAFSCKVQAGRGAFVQALRMARALLHGGGADSVLLGGLFRSFPVLCFAEALSGNAAERAWLGRGGQHNAPLVERAGFIVLRRAEALASARQPGLLLGEPHYLQAPRGREAAAKALAGRWAELLPEQRALVYGGLYPSSLLDQVEAGAAAARGEQWVYENICRRFGDSGGLNPLLALQRHAERKAVAADTPPALLSLSDSQGGTWLLRGE